MGQEELCEAPLNVLISFLCVGWLLLTSCFRVCLLARICNGFIEAIVNSEQGLTGSTF